MSKKPKSVGRRPPSAVPVMRNRFTGEILRVGCRFDPTGVLGEDVRPSQVLWRYMGFTKFQSLLERRALHFRRLDRLRVDGEDPDALEGVLSPDGKPVLADVDLQIAASVGCKLSAEEMINGNRLHAVCSWVSCWTMKDFEDRRMWKAYARSPSGVVIRTTVRKLQNALLGAKPPLMFGPVLYTEPEAPRPITPGWNAPSFRKPLKFEWEREFRILRNLGAEEAMPHDDPEWYDRFVGVSLRDLIGQIRLHPDASVGDFETVLRLV